VAPTERLHSVACSHSRIGPAVVSTSLHTGTMHQAPPVTYPLGNAQCLRRWVGSAWALVITIDVLWLVQAQWQDWKLWFGLALTVLAGACAYRVRPAHGKGDLHWDGSGWSHREGARETAGLASVHLDLQSGLLVFWAPASGGGAWLWLSSTVQPAQWLALRRALFSPDRTTPGQDDGAQADRVARP